MFSDDLTMEGAAIMGGPADRAKAALNAGCDMVLMCNKRDAQIEALDHLAIQEVPLANSLLKNTTLIYRRFTRIADGKRPQSKLSEC